MPERPDLTWRRLGAHVDRGGVRFGVWAPNAAAVSVVGDFDDWDPRAHPLNRADDGTWSGHVAGIGPGTLYQFALTTPSGDVLVKSDPFARRTQLQPQRSSIVEQSTYEWQDTAWSRPDSGPTAPMSVYEVHLGSWRRGEAYADLAATLVPYVRDLGFTHVELMPVMEHPFLGSWGYQVTGYYAPTSRYGSPDDLRALIDAFHAAGIAVILDWVPGHFPGDAWALQRFDGEALFESAEGPTKWETHSFDYANPSVRGFLVDNALYWLTEFRADGLRVDAVDDLIGQGGDAALTFLRELNAAVHAQVPGAVTIAEDAAARDGITGSLPDGLGFDHCWSLGWEHDVFGFLWHDPLWRSLHHGGLVQTAAYVFRESFVLAISHDEVVFGKGSLANKASAGTRDDKVADLRAFLGFMWAHPGKQLLFMGCELAQEAEWDERRSLDWDSPYATTTQALLRDLNAAYVAHPALWKTDGDSTSFAWLVNAPELNVVAFARWTPTDVVVCVSSFSGIDQVVEVPGVDAAEWTVLLSTSDPSYGGPGPATLSGSSLRVPSRSTTWLIRGTT